MSERRARAVVFDLWNTLVPFPASSWVADFLAPIAAVLGAPTETLQRIWLETWPERATSDLAVYLEAVCARIELKATPAQIERALEIRTLMHRRAWAPRADAEPTLLRLRAIGVRTAVVSNTSSEVPPLWCASSLAGLVNVAVFSCTEGVMKPDPRIYRLAATRLGMTPEECVYVGDGADDELDGASAAGMRPVLLRPGDTEAPAHWSGLEIAALSETLKLLGPTP